jgi:hypothetical protein
MANRLIFNIEFFATDEHKINKGQDNKEPGQQWRAIATMAISITFFIPIPVVVIAHPGVPSSIQTLIVQ